MKKITKQNLVYLNNLIKSLQYEYNKALENDGEVSVKYINEKCDKIKSVVNRKSTPEKEDEDLGLL